MVLDLNASGEVAHLKEADCQQLHAINASFWPTGRRQGLDMNMSRSSNTDEDLGAEFQFEEPEPESEAEREEATTVQKNFLDH